jgi:hypothetical protein
MKLEYTLLFWQLVKTGNATVGKVYKVKQNEVAQQEPQRKETVHVVNKCRLTLLT